VRHLLLKASAMTRTLLQSRRVYRLERTRRRGFLHKLQLFWRRTRAS
jgi:hypothetical protein